MATKPQRYSTARSFISKKYGKSLWTCGNVDNIGTYDVQNSLFGHLQSSTMKCSSRQLRQWRAIVSDVDGTLSRGWRVNQFQHQSFKPKLFTREIDNVLSNYSDNNTCFIHDTNSSIYFGATNHWLQPNNGMKVWQILDNDRLNSLNENANLSGKDTYLGTSWYKPKAQLQSGGYSGMRYQATRPYGFNVFVDYSSSARGPCSQDLPYIHTVQKVNDIYNKLNNISKFKLKDGVSISSQRIFKSLRRTNTTRNRRSYYTQTMLDNINLMNPCLPTNILVAFAAKSVNSMILKIKVQLYDQYYYNNRRQMFDQTASVENVYRNYHQAFTIQSKQSPLPSVSGGAISSVGIRSAQLSFNVDSNWRLYWIIAPFKTGGIQRGVNDVLYHAGRQLINVDKAKISFSVPRSSRNRQFYLDFADFLISQQVTYSTLTQRPLTVTSTIFNGSFHTMNGDNRQYAYGTISQSQFIKRNCPPFLFKIKPNSQKLQVNYQNRTVGQLTQLSDVTNQELIQLNNFRNSKLAYEVF